MSRQSHGRTVVVVLGLLVSGALVASGTLDIISSFQANKAELIALQREKATTAALRIEQFLGEIERQLGVASSVSATRGANPADRRRAEYLRLLREAPPVTEIGYIDSAGREQLRVSRLALPVPGGIVDFSNKPEFQEPEVDKPYFGPIYFRNGSEPYITIGLAESGQPGGVTIAEVNLRFIWDVVWAINVGQAGYAYVVDGRGRLIAHPDVSLVLHTTNHSLEQRENTADTLRDTVIRRTLGTHVLSATESVNPPGWSVVVGQPLEEAFAPLYASILRTALLLIVGLGVSVLAARFLT